MHFTGSHTRRRSFADELLNEFESSVESGLHQSGPFNNEAPRFVAFLSLREQLAQPTNWGARKTYKGLIQPSAAFAACTKRPKESMS